MAEKYGFHVSINSLSDDKLPPLQNAYLQNLKMLCTLSVGEDYMLQY